MLEEHGPEAAGEGTHVSPGIGQATKCVTDDAWDGERDHRPYVVRAVVELYDGVALQVAAVDVAVGRGVVEHPPNVRMEKPPKRVGVVTVSIDDGTVSVPAVVSLRVVAAMVGDPG